MSEGGRVWIQGAGELASGVAVRLVRCGYRVVMAEIPAPLAVRRLVCFSEAVYGGRQQVEDVPAVCLPAAQARFAAGTVTVCVDPLARVLADLACEAVVDARMTKRKPAPLPGRAGPLIGLGPGFDAGVDADFVVETQRGPRLGSVILRGPAAADTGIPGEIGGHGALRVVRAPAAGRLLAQARIGDLVQAGQVLGTVAGREVRAGLGGLLRGLVHGEAELSCGVKVADVDPRGAAVDPALVSDKALAVAGGVLEALLRAGVGPAAERGRGWTRTAGL